VKLRVLREMRKREEVEKKYMTQIGPRLRVSRAGEEETVMKGSLRRRQPRDDHGNGNKKHPTAISAKRYLPNHQKHRWSPPPPRL